MANKIAAVTFSVDPNALSSFKSYYQTGSGSSKTYEYAFDDSVFDLEAGDIAVVATPSHGYTCVRVVRVCDPVDAEYWGNRKPIVSKVTSPIIEKAKRQAKAEELSKRLTKMANEARKQIGFETLFANNPEAMKLVEELKQLQA